MGAAVSRGRRMCSVRSWMHAAKTACLFREERIKIAFRNSRPGHDIQRAGGRKTGFGDQVKRGFEYALADGSGEYVLDQWDEAAWVLFS